MTLSERLGRGWDYLIESFSPKTILNLYRFFDLIHSGFHFIWYMFGGRFVYVILFALSAGLLYILQSFRTVLTATPIDTSKFLNLNFINWNLVLSWEELGKIIGVYIIILFIYWLWQSRSILVIEEFSDDTGSDEKSRITGIESLLIVELNHINQLYMDVNEQRPISTTIGENQQVSAVLKVDGDEDLLAKAESAGGKISLGPIEVPVGLFFSIFNTMSRGPRIRGSIRKGEGGFILLATISGMPKNISWNVTEGPFPFEETAVPKNDQVNAANHSIEKMARELACRIFTDIPATGSPRWEATYLFNQGLKRYRECLNTPQDQISHLKNAEDCFQRALLYDNKFASAWYNLGVVYSELGRKTAAQKAFLRSIEQDPNQPKAYYALSQNRYQVIRYLWDVKGSNVIDYPTHILRNSQQVTALCQNNDPLLSRLRKWIQGGSNTSPSSLMAQNLNLMGLTYIKTAEFLPDSNPGSQKECTRKAISQLKKAVIMAWRSYSSFSLYGIDNDYYRKKQWVDTCRNLGTFISDLGWAYILDAYYSRCVAIKKQNDKNENNKINNKKEINELIEKARQSLDTAESLLNYALILNSDLKSECTCPELHWRLGVARICNKKSVDACKEFHFAIQINPEVLKYRISLVFGRAFLGPNREKADSVCIAESGCIGDALQYVMQSYDNEKAQRDDQWKSLNLLQKMISCSYPQNEIEPVNKSFFYCFENLKKFAEFNYNISERLDFYDEKLCKEAEDTINKMENCLGRNKQDHVNPRLPEYFVQCTLLKHWMLGHIHLAQGRIWYYKAVNWPETEYDTIENFYKNAENKFCAALHHLRYFPDECPHVYSRIGLVRTFCNSHNYCTALSKIATAHELNPTGVYEHVVQGMIALTLKNYGNAINYNEEALRRAYHLPTYSQYILNNYFRNLAYSQIQQARPCDDKKIKDIHYTGALKTLDLACDIFSSEYKKNLEADKELIWPKNVSQRFRQHKSSQYFQSIIATWFWKAQVSFERKDYQTAIYYLQIVNSFYKPNGCHDISFEKTKTTPIKRWPGFKEYLITLFSLAETHYQLKDYSTATKYFDDLLKYEPLVKDPDRKGFFGRKIWYQVHPNEIFIWAFLRKVRLCVDMHIACPEIPLWTEKAGSLNQELERVKATALTNTNQDSTINDYFDQSTKSAKAELEKNRGLVALQFNYPDDLNNPSALTNDLKPTLSSTCTAIGSFEKAIALNPEPETYVFLLKAIEKMIEVLKSGEYKNNTPEEKSAGGKEQCSEKTDIPSCIRKSTGFLEALKRLDTAGKNTEFIEEFGKKIQNWSKSPEGDSKKNVPVVCCIAPCPPETTPKSDT